MKKKPSSQYVDLDHVWESLAHKSVSLDTFRARLSKNQTLDKALKTPATSKDVTKEGRRTITSALTQAASGFLIKKGYAVFRELGVEKWGGRRADIVGINLYGYIVICEVKSCRADLTADRKYHTYLKHCNKLYLVFPHTMTVPKELSDSLKKDGIGIIKLGTNGLANVYVRAKHRTIDPDASRAMTNRAMWRNATVSKRTSRRIKIFLDTKHEP